MGWGIRLLTPSGDLAQTERHTFGSQYAVGGTTDASTTVTFNYSGHYHDSGVQTPKPWTEHRGESRTDFSPWWLHGRTGRETAPVLMQVVQSLGTERASNYWESTAGNAGYAMSVLWLWAIDHPDCIWEVD